MFTRDPREFERKKRIVKGIYHDPEDRNRNEFVKRQIKSFDTLSQSFKKIKTRYTKYFDPKLIFKITLNSVPAEKSLRKDLERAGVELISPSPDKQGYWVAFAKKEDLAQFKQKLKSYENNKSNFFSAVESFGLIPNEDKIGNLLKDAPFGRSEVSNLDVDIWRMNDTDLDKFLNELDDLISAKGGAKLDQLITSTFCVLRVRMTRGLYEEMLNLPAVAHIDRPPRIRLEVLLEKETKDFAPKGPPKKDATGILIVDSGLLPQHPLLEGSVVKSIAAKGKGISTDMPNDDVGHGTEVAGIALYGDLEECISNESFRQEIWLYSAKVLFKDIQGLPRFDPDELLEHQLKDSIDRMVENYKDKFRIVNLSLGNTANIMYQGRRQYNLAALVDELAWKHDLIFVISTGNYESNTYENYPDYLVEDNSDAKIVDPASSILGITVGALYKKHTGKLFEYAFYPSPFTRSGPGYGGMIKPELVELGGGGLGFQKGEEILDESGVITLNPKWVKKGNHFTISRGTSLSAPKVAHDLAFLINKFPSFSNNMIKALLLSSASIPSYRPGILKDLKFHSNSREAASLLKVYGYGKPDLEKALFSNTNRVLLINESSISPGDRYYYPFFLPKEFIEEPGERFISVTLVFDPPIKNDVMVSMESHLYKNKSIDEIDALYRASTKKAMEEETEDEDAETSPPELAEYEIRLAPGTRLRNKGVHQRGIKRFVRDTDIDTKYPIVLALTCQDKGGADDDYMQDYAIIVSIEHTVQIDLYNQIRLRNRERVRFRT